MYFKDFVRCKSFAVQRGLTIGGDRGGHGGGDREDINTMNSNDNNDYVEVEGDGDGNGNKD